MLKITLSIEKESLNCKRKHWHWNCCIKNTHVHEKYNLWKKDTCSSAFAASLSPFPYLSFSYLFFIILRPCSSWYLCWFAATASCHCISMCRGSGFWFRGMGVEKVNCKLSRGHVLLPERSLVVKPGWLVHYCFTTFRFF